MDSKTEQVRNYFDSTDQYKSGVKPGTREKLNYLHESSSGDGRLLDVGCGSGAFLNAALEKQAISEGVGMDISMNMLPDDENDYLLGDAQAPPFDETTFDFVHLDCVLHHIVGGTRAGSKQRATDTLSSLIDTLTVSGALLITERIHTPHVGSQKILSDVIFNGLKYGSQSLEPIHHNIRRNQPPISFYGEQELVEMIRDAGGVVERISASDVPDIPFVQSLIMSKSERTNIFVSKKK